jgi:hypothetical protein
MEPAPAAADAEFIGAASAYREGARLIKRAESRRDITNGNIVVVLILILVAALFFVLMIMILMKS